MENIVEIEKKKSILNIINSLKSNFNVTSEQIMEVILESETSFIPIEIFADRKLSSLQALVKYLIENKDLKKSQIASLLDRNNKTIWSTYDAAKKLKKEKFFVEHSELPVPLSIFKNRELSVLENLVNYLKKKGFSNQKIIFLLDRKASTISTVIKRAMNKLEKHN